MKLNEVKQEDIKIIHVEWVNGGWTEFREVQDFDKVDNFITVTYKNNTSAMINLNTVKFVEFLQRD